MWLLTSNWLIMASDTGQTPYRNNMFVVLGNSLDAPLRVRHVRESNLACQKSRTPCLSHWLCRKFRTTKRGTRRRLDLVPRTLHNVIRKVTNSWLLRTCGTFCGQAICIIRQNVWFTFSNSRTRLLTTLYRNVTLCSWLSNDPATELPILFECSSERERENASPKLQRPNYETICVNFLQLTKQRKNHGSRDGESRWIVILQRIK